MIDRHIKQLCTELNFDPPFEPRPPGIYTYPLEENLSFTITTLQPAGMLLECTLGRFACGKDEEIFSDMLSGNLFGQATHGAVLGLDHTGELVKLSRHMPRLLTYGEFRDAIEDFINVIDFWRERIQHGP